SDYDTKQYVAAGGFAGGSAAVGATVLTTVITNEVLALVGFGATVNAGGAGYGIAVKNREARRKGVSVSATSNETFLAVAISGAGGDNVAVAGVVNTGVFSNVVHAIIYGGGTVTANSDDSEGDLGISAASNSNIYMVAGSLDGAGTAGVGATVTVFTYDKDVVASANAHATGTINARNVEVKAGDTHVVDDLTEGGEADSSKTSDRLYLFAVSISGAGTAAVGAGATVLYFDNSNVAELGGTVIATGDVTVRAENDSHLINANGAVAGSGTGSVTGVVAVTYFRTSTIARIVEGSSVRGPAREYAGNVSVTAESKERVDADVVGITGSGTAAVSGTVAVVITNVTVKAYVGTEDGDATPTASTIKGASLKVIANDDFTMLGIAGTAAIGTAGVGVTAVIAKTSNTVEAYVGRLTNVMCVGDVDIKALGNRDVQMYLATVSGGTVGVGVTVLVTVVGGKLDQDSHDALLETQEPAPKLDEEGNEIPQTDAIGDKDGEVTFFDPDKLWDDLLESLLLEDYVSEKVKTPVAADLATYYEYTGDYFETTDTEVDPNKVYYYLDNSNGNVAGTYRKVKHPKAAELSTYYEKNKTPYVQTEDTTLVSGKDYYAQVDPNTEANKAIYAKLAGTDLREDLEGDGQYHTDEGVNGSELSDVTFLEVEEPDDKSIGTYYELVNGSYVETTDLVVVPDKTYYVARNNATLNITVTSTAGKSATATDLGEADVPVINGEDTVRAFVATGATVNANNITIEAKSHLLLDLMAFTVSGGTVAVCPTVAVGITYANVAAYVEDDATLVATGDVKVTSWTGSTKVLAPENSDEAARNKAFSDQVSAGAEEGT
ncbi:MAG: hypothetical protein IJH42_03615, partial [Atopobiaceae bacterium]|nr:hypothetical protein [Atopobiaceae bacterium]